MSFRLSIEGIRKVVSGLAAFVLILSMFAEAFPTSTPDCCRGKMCPIHHKHTMPTKAGENSHLDCEHQGMGLPPCSMSCGHSDEQGLQTTVVYLLSDSGASVALIPVERAPLVDLAFSSDLAVRPLIPPPRLPSQP